MSWNRLSITALIVAVVLATSSIFTIYRIQHRPRMRFDLERFIQEQEERDMIDQRLLFLRREIATAMGVESKTIEMIILDKKERFSKVSGVSFHYVDKDEVKGFYNDTFREPTFESLISEITGEVSAEIKGGLPKILESKIGGRDINKWISTIKLPETSLSGMFVKYQKEMIQRDEITLGLEELDIELKDLHEFNTSVEKLDEAFAFVVPSELVEEHRTKLREKAAEKTLAKLEAASGWVLMEGKFAIARSENLYICTLHHPVNEFLSEEAAPLTISIFLPKDGIEQRYASNYARSVGKVIPLRVFGKVWQPVNRAASVWELQITPLAVY